MENKPVKYISMMGSASHTYGNALAFIENWLINLFPEGLFKSVYVNSRIAHRELKSTPHEFLKKMKPMFIIRPRVAIDEDQKFLANTPIIKRMGDLYSTYGSTNLEPFFFDGEKEIAIKYHLNRYVMYADVILMFDTFMEALNYAHYFTESTRIDIPFNLKTCMESYISQEMLEMVSEITGIPLYDEDGSTRNFVEYMNGHSIYPITYKLQKSTKTREFYRYYPATIDTVITDFRTDDGEKFGHVTSNYQITFTVRMEFFGTGFYYLFSDKCHEVKKPIIDKESSVLIPVYTDVLLEEDLHLRQGWNHYTDASIMLEKKEDTLCFESLLNQSIKRAIHYHIKNGLPMFDLIDIIIRKQGKPLIYGKEYTIDFEKLEINFNVDDYMFYTYHIIICINTKYMNDLIKDIFELQ